MANEGKSLKINAALNIIRQVCAIVFPLITFPYVSRTLGVEAYGKVNFSTSILSYISLLAGLGVSSYAIREGARIRDDRERFERFADEVFSINVVSTLISYVVLAVLVLFWSKLDAYRALIGILSVNILLTTLGTDWINTIYEDFLYLTVRYVICQTIAVAATLLFVKGPEDVALYAVCSNMGMMLANASNLFYIRKKLGIRLKLTWKMNVRRHLRPIMLLFGNMISSMIYLYSDTTMLGVFIGDAAVGFYTVSSRIYSLIKQLINAVSGVLVPRLSHDLESKSGGESNGSVHTVLGILTVVVFPIALGMICMGREIIVLIAGEAYAAAYPALAILSIALIFATYACIYISVVMLAQRKDREILFASSVSALTNIVLNFILIPRYSYNAAAFTTLVSEFLMLAMGVYYTRRTISLKIGGYLLLAVAGCAEVVLICAAAKRVLSGVPALFAAVALCGAVYGLTVLFAWRLSQAKGSRKN